MDDGVLTPREAGEYCGVNRTTITNWIRRRGLKAQRLPNGYFRVRKGDLDAFLHRFDVYRREARPSAERTVLVAGGGDGDGLREVLRAAFGERYRVLEGARLSETVALARRERPDAILIEILPGEARGREILRRLKSDRLTASIPVVILTARRDATEAVRAVELGARDFILKPFGMNEFVVRLESAIRRA